MGIQHFSGLFVLLCMGVGGALLTLAGEHTFYHLVVPRLRRSNTLQYWLHTSQVGEHMGQTGMHTVHPLLLLSPPSHLAHTEANILQRCADAACNLIISLWCSRIPAAPAAKFPPASLADNLRPLLLQTFNGTYFEIIIATIWLFITEERYSLTSLCYVNYIN